MRKWAFTIHPRDKIDMIKVIGYVSDKVDIREVAKQMEPRVLSRVVSEKSEGWLIGCSLFPDQFYSLPLNFVLSKILNSVLFAKQLGAEVIGLGELISPFTSGGRWLTREVSDLLITNGNSLTAAVVVEETERILQLTNSKPEKTWIAVVGATGSVGSAVSKMLKEKNLLLVARNTQKLERLRSLVLPNNNKVTISTDIRDIKIADLVIVLTSAAETIIRSEYLKATSMVYDITQPSNLSPEIANKRLDATLIKGGLMRKEGLELNFDMRIPKETVFSCVAETIVLAENESYYFLQSELVGDAKVETAKRLLLLAKECGFEPAGSKKQK